MNAAYRSFWKTWAILLALTVVMVFVDVVQAPRALLVIVLLGAMLTKAFLIGAEFMDLKHERLVVGVAVAFSLLFFGAVLYALMVPDGLAILRGGR
ncbi:MAG TPA: cytochrome C oxidase subunit IV family protein [Vicinamibacteria bacterium]|nr:cytochrome C oxidase subunit IV family protein [Vicinamibacteria bacterium]